ncbi:iron-siderophore ABC transporter substrate-binding protein [Devosia riboflavina]|uniref:iron-siderophore ABC transporter substrate-binding protein n=1 Tax=Devosia riboflavina TaxID=46914 RepID=UPI00068DCEE6|nr:iron-siderophore ABC transporter substrate-binding protein [Devosia riboflavina]
MILRSLVFAALVATSPTMALAQSFPVTLEHAWGETTIDAEPKRIVTWGWGNEDAVLALGVTPVGIPFHAYGGGEDGIKPWIEEALAKVEGDKPTVLENGSEPPFEQIAALEPDLILAVFSGITEEQYALFSAIAPTIAYSGDAWSTPWQEVTTTIGKALGKADEAEALVAETTTWLESEVAKHPALKEITFASANDYDGSIAVYAPLDARMKFLTDLGMTLDPSVAENAPDDGAFYYSLSYELFDNLKGDIFVTYYEEQSALDEWLAKSYAANYPPIVNGGLAALVGTENVAAVSPPSVLSLHWGFPTYLDVLASAAEKVTGQ